MESNKIKKVPVNIHKHDSSDNCLNCQIDAHIAEIHIPSGLCGVCYQSDFKLTKELANELLKLDEGLK